MTPTNPDDTLLLRAARADDAEAFACLVVRYQARVIGFAARFFGGDRDAGMDIAQDTFIRLWENRHAYIATGKLLDYLLRVAYNLCVSRSRSPESKLFPLDAANDSATHTAPEGLALAVRDALFALPEAQRTVFLLHEYEGLSYTEIADVLSIAPGTVASRKHAAVQALRVSLAPWHGDGTEDTR